MHGPTLSAESIQRRKSGFQKEQDYYWNYIFLKAVEMEWKIGLLSPIREALNKRKIALNETFLWNTDSIKCLNELQRKCIEKENYFKKLAVATEQNLKKQVAEGTLDDYELKFYLSCHAPWLEYEPFYIQTFSRHEATVMGKSTDAIAPLNDQMAALLPAGFELESLIFRMLHEESFLCLKDILSINVMWLELTTCFQFRILASCSE